MAEELRQQVPVMKDVLRAMGVKVIEKKGYEADDVIGTLSRICEEKGMDVSVISGDRDLLQLATQKVKIRIPKTKQGRTEIEDYYADDVMERYLVTPKEFIDLKALMGDTADNIPGVPSIGEKTATKIITQYHSIENAHEHVDELKPPRASKALKEHYDMAEMSKILATINVQTPIEYELEEAKIKNLYTEEAYVFFQRLQFKNLLGRFDISAPKNNVEEFFKQITKKEEADKIFKEAAKAATVGVSFLKDTQNVLPLFVNMAEMGDIGISYGKEDVYDICIGNDITAEYLFEKISDLTDQTEIISIYNVKEALKYITFKKESSAFDPIIAAYLLNPLKNDYEYDDVSREYLDIMLDEKMESMEKTCYMAYTAYASVEPLMEKLKETDMYKLFCEIEMPLVFTLFDMEQAGVKIAADELKAYGNELGEKITEIEKEIYEEAGETFNINSPKQLGVVLFEHMQLPNGKKTKTGYSTAADVLEKLAPDHPVVSKILEYRQLSKLKSTYADGLANYISEDGRIHGKFNQTITATGSISSK